MVSNEIVMNIVLYLLKLSIILKSSNSRFYYSVTEFPSNLTEEYFFVMNKTYALFVD